MRCTIKELNNFHTAGFAVTGQPYHRIRPAGLQVRLKLCRQIANLPERIHSLRDKQRFRRLLRLV